jgi:hypothetical protein
VLGLSRRPFVEPLDGRGRLHPSHEPQRLFDEQGLALDDGLLERRSRLVQTGEVRAPGERRFRAHLVEADLPAGGVREAHVPGRVRAHPAPELRVGGQFITRPEERRELRMLDLDPSEHGEHAQRIHRPLSEADLDLPLLLRRLLLQRLAQQVEQPDDAHHAQRRDREHRVVRPVRSAEERCHRRTILTAPPPGLQGRRRTRIGARA